MVDCGCAPRDGAGEGVARSPLVETRQLKTRPVVIQIRLPKYDMSFVGVGFRRSLLPPWLRSKCTLALAQD